MSEELNPSPETPQEPSGALETAGGRKKELTFRAFWKNYGYLFTTVIVMVILFRGIFLLGYVTSGSMETTLPTRSVFLSWRLSYLVGDPMPERGSIVLFDSDELDQTLVKRVVGLPGETVSFQDGQVLIDGVALEEKYLPVQGITYPLSDGDTFTVPEGCVFLLGDHRDNSLDSRFWQEPFIPVSNIRSRALVDISLLPGNSWLGVRRVG